ncbi:MAG: HEAT repeat domain-containing protein [Stenotrophomonas sp.]
MDSLTEGPTVLVVASGVAIFTLLLASVLLAIIVVLRIRAQRRDRRDKQARQYWVEVLQRELAGETVPVKQLQRDEVIGFIEAWNALCETLPDASVRRLASLGHRVGLAEASQRMLRGSYHDRAMTIIALGHLRDRHLYDQLVKFLDDRSPIVSLCAARALAQVDPPRAMSAFVPMIAQREDWVPGSVARILAENVDGSAAREISNALLRANADSTVKLVRFLADIDPHRAAVVVRQLLDGHVDDHIISVCLQLINDSQDRERVIGFLSASRWHVRMHAAAALGRIGSNGDRARLEALLSDSVWWVRYRTAQALLALPGMGVEALREVQTRHADTYGRDIIEQVLSEHALRSAT